MSNSSTKIRGRGLYEVFNRNFGDDRAELHNWLIMDTWPYEAAMWLIAGIIPTQIYDGFGFHKFEGGLVGDEKSDRIAQIQSLTRLWLSNPLHPKNASPQFYFDWADRKGIDIYWLEAAKEWGHFNKGSTNQECDKSDPVPTKYDSPTEEVKRLTDRERSGLLNIIGAMLELLQTPRAGRESDAAVITELVKNYSDKYGISKSNLEGKFSAAKRSLKT